MKKVLFIALLLLPVTCFVAHADVNAGASASNVVISYDSSIVDYFTATQKEVTVARDRGISDDEIPVVFFMSRLAEVSPPEIINLRLNGKSWQEVARHYEYGPGIFYYPIKENAAVVPPYGKAYGYYKSKPIKEWNKIKLGDDDIINLVNLEFLSEYNNYPALTIMAMRGKNKGFKTISDEIDGQRELNKKNAAAAQAKKVQAVDNPDHLTGTKKQVEKVKKFFNKKQRKANMYINDKG
jgi:hypothetical protein